jgi:hypothetical protein
MIGEVVMHDVGWHIYAGDALAAEINIFSGKISGTISFSQSIAVHGPVTLYRRAAAGIEFQHTFFVAVIHVTHTSRGRQPVFLVIHILAWESVIRKISRRVIR